MAFVIICTATTVPLYLLSFIGSKFEQKPVKIKRYTDPETFVGRVHSTNRWWCGAAHNDGTN